MSIDESVQLTEAMEGCAARIAQEYADAEIFNNWNPPDGKHIVLIVDCKDDISKKNNKAWCRLVCRMLDPDPELRGKEFKIWYNEAKPKFVIENAMVKLAGRKSSDFHELLKVLRTTVGWTIKILVKTNKKGDKSYKNYLILGIVSKAPEAPKASQVPTKD